MTDPDLSIADKVYREVRRLPEPLGQEVLDFIGYLESKHSFADQDNRALKQAQVSVMDNIWANDTDEVWDEW